jgi:hypothetical protein
MMNAATTVVKSDFMTSRPRQLNGEPGIDFGSVAFGFML